MPKNKKISSCFSRAKFDPWVSYSPIIDQQKQREGVNYGLTIFEYNCPLSKTFY